MVCSFIDKLDWRLYHIMNKIIGSTGLKLAYAYLNSNPEKNIPALMDWVDRFDRKDTMSEVRAAKASRKRTITGTS